MSHGLIAVLKSDKIQYASMWLKKRKANKESKGLFTE